MSKTKPTKQTNKQTNKQTDEQTNTIFVNKQTFCKHQNMCNRQSFFRFDNTQWSVQKAPRPSLFWTQTTFWNLARKSMLKMRTPFLHHQLLSRSQSWPWTPGRSQRHIKFGTVLLVLHLTFSLPPSCLRTKLSSEGILP